MSMNLQQEPDWNWFQGRTVLITGAANGLGRGMARKWAENGAFVVVGDMDETAGRIVLEELRRISSKDKHLFVKTDVTSWASQVDLFKQAMEKSPGKHIDVVVANAGIGESDPEMFLPKANLELKKPNVKTIDIDLTGVIYTAHLAYWAFAQPFESNNKSKSAESPRHHSLLLIGSMASLKYSSEPMYAAAKHGVLGLFRTLRRPHYFLGFDRNSGQYVGSGSGDDDKDKSGGDGSTSTSTPTIKIKPGLLCPYFVDTNIIKKDGVKALPESVELTKIEEVVEAASRIVLDKEGGKAMMVLTHSMAKIMGKGKNKGGIVEIGGLGGKL